MRDCCFGKRDVFAILGILALLAFLTFASVGCAGFSRRNVLTIKNMSSYDISVEVNGQQLGFCLEDGRVVGRLRTGQSGWVSVLRTGEFIATAWSGNEAVEVATFRKEGYLYDSYGTGYGHGYYGHRYDNPESWILRDRDFDSRGGPVINLRGIFR